jgi:uncharacterized short protein YbdD (DUF466 family)
MQLLKRLLQWWNGDAAYARYLAHHQQTHGDATPMTRREFFVSEQQRKWSGISRCC